MSENANFDKVLYQCVVCGLQDDGLKRWLDTLHFTIQLQTVGFWSITRCKEHKNNSMKKTFSMLCLAMLLLASCNSSNSSTEDLDVSYVPVKTTSDGDWGMVGPDGKMLFENEFKEQPSPVIGGVFAVPEKDGLSVYRAAGKPTIVAGMENLQAVGLPAEGMLVYINKEGLINITSLDGQNSVSLPDNIIGCQAYFCDGMLSVVNKEGKWGYVDITGKQVIPCKYDGTSKFGDGVAFVGTMRDDKMVVEIIDKTGAVVGKVRENITINAETRFFNGKCVAVNSDDRCGFLDKDGTFNKLNAEVVAVTETTDAGFIFKTKDGLYGAMDYEGNSIVRARYDALSYVPGTRNFFSRIGNTYSLLNAKGEKITDITGYQSIVVAYPNFPLVAYTGSRFEYLDKDGKTIGNMDFPQIGDNTVFTTRLMLERGANIPSDSDIDFGLTNYVELVESMLSKVDDTLNSIDSDDEIESGDSSYKGFSGEMQFRGSIGKYPIEMVMDFTALPSVIGKYRYTRSGSGDWLDIVGEFDGQDLTLQENNDNGTITGEFVGKMNNSNFKYVGTFSTPAGKSFAFSVEPYTGN